MSRDERDEMIWLYAAGALDAAEAGQVRAWIDAGEPADLATYRDALDTVSDYAGSLTPLPVPSDVRNRLMARVGSSPAATLGAVRDQPSRLRLFRLVSGLAAGIAVTLGLYSAYLFQQRHEAREQLAEARDQIAERDAQLSRQDGDIAARQAEIEQVRAALTATRDELVASKKTSQDTIEALNRKLRTLSTPDLKLVQLSGAEPQIAGRGRVFWDQKNGTWVVYVFGMSPPPAGRVFELWFIKPDQTKVPAGTFTVDADGNGSITVPVPADLDQIALAAITDEPAGGSPQPTGTVRLVGQIQ